MNRVAIIDYGMCNLDSVARAIEELGGNSIVTDQYQDIKTANRIILPGVGAYKEAMNNVRQRSLDKILNDIVLSGQIPFLGICLGMQLLAQKGWEVDETEGLGWIPGDVKKLEPFGEDTRIPHIGWNEVILEKESPIFKDIPSGKDFYFVHSYHLIPTNHTDTVARTPYAEGFVSAVEKGNIFGVQFHPEKSQKPGFKLLDNFLHI